MHGVQIFLLQKNERVNKLDILKKNLIVMLDTQIILLEKVPLVLL